MNANPEPDEVEAQDEIECPCCGQTMLPGEALAPLININKPYTLTLDVPILMGKTEITELVFKPICAAHVEHVHQGGTFADLFEVARKQTGQPPSVIKRLGGTDTARVMEVVNIYMIPFLRIGEKRSRS